MNNITLAGNQHDAHVWSHFTADVWYDAHVSAFDDHKIAMSNVIYLHR